MEKSKKESNKNIKENENKPNNQIIIYSTEDGEMI